MRNGEVLKFRIQEVQSEQLKDIRKLFLNYNLTEEPFHKAAGIYKNSKAIEDYKKILPEIMLEKPSYQNDICFLEDDNDKIVAFNSVALYKKGELCQGFAPQGKAKELKKLFDIHNELDNLLPLSKIFGKYNIDKYIEDIGCAVHPDYAGYGISYTIGTLRYMLCERQAIPLLGGWVTALATQRATKLDGWETIYKVSYEQLGKKLGHPFKDAPLSLKYKIRRIL